MFCSVDDGFVGVKSLLRREMNSFRIGNNVLGSMLE
jgi:hypothetical protein